MLLVLAGTALAAAPATGLAAAKTPRGDADSQLVIEGAGDGHGVGMSQWGALGFAEHGFGYREILAHYYPGTAIGRAPAGRAIRVLVGSVVRRVPLESYVRGVIASEMPAGWPLAALEAQAVAARTYALTSDAGGKRFDVYANTRSQVYRGPAAQTAATDQAASATAGQIVTYEGHPAVTYYDASSGGQTEDVQNAFPGAAAEPWLRSVSDPYETGPVHTWTRTLSFRAAAHDLAGLFQGSFRGVEVLTRGASPRIMTAEVLGSKGSSTVTGQELQSRLHLDSTWAHFSIRRGSSSTPEPDRSGWQPPSAGSQEPAPAPEATTAPGSTAPGSTAPGGTPPGESPAPAPAPPAGAGATGGTAVTH